MEGVDLPDGRPGRLNGRGGLQPDTDQAHVIGRLLAVHMPIDQLANKFANGFRSFRLTGLDLVDQSVNPQLVALFIHRLIDPVRIQDQYVTRHEGEVQRMIRFIQAEAQWQSGNVVVQQHHSAGIFSD